MISKQQVEHMAKLARIELTENEKKKFQKELSSILDYVKQLNRVDTSKIDRIAQITGLENVVRDDESGIPESYDGAGKNYELREKILKNVPSKKGDYIKVPKILE